MNYIMSERQMELKAGQRTKTEITEVIQRQTNGGIWGNHPRYPAALWQDCVHDGDTRLGYWEWVANRIDMQEENG